MILLDYDKDKVTVTYCFHLVQNSTPPEFIKVDMEVEI